MILEDQGTIAKYREIGAWGDRTIDEVFSLTAGRASDEVAIVDAPNRMALDGKPPRRLTYAQYNAEVYRCAAGLIKAGVRKDDFVLVQAPNVIDLIVLIQACARTGAIISPAPVQYGAHELTQILNQLGDVVIALTTETFKGADRIDYLTTAISNAEAPPPVRSIASLCEDIDQREAKAIVDEYCRENPINADEIFTLCWTSGTTAAPKGVPRSHNNWLWHGACVVEAGNYQTKETLLSPFPAVNMGGFGSALLPWWLTGGKLVLHHPFDLETYVKQIQDEKVGVTLAAPAVLTALLKDEALLNTYDISSLHDVPSGAAALSPWLIETFKARFGIDIINQFGSNEGLTLASSPFEVEDPVARAALFPRIGHPDLEWRLNFTKFVESRLEDDDGNEVTEPGSLGELVMRSPSIFPGYWKRPDLTQDAFTEDGFYRSGDLFELVAADGDESDIPRFYRFAGRSKELIIRGGFNIAPPEIESLLLAHDDILEAAVIGWPDERLGERVCACIVMQPERPPLTLGDITSLFDAADVARFKWPERLHVRQSLPRNAVGKVVKRDLLKALQAEVENAEQPALT